MIMPVVETTENLRRNGMVVFFHNDLSTRVLCSVKSLQQTTMCQEIDFRSIDQVLLDIRIQNGMQFFLRKQGFFHHRFHDFQCFRQILVQ